jgi:hypothetical protein
MSHRNIDNKAAVADSIESDASIGIARFTDFTLGQPDNFHLGCRMHLVTSDWWLVIGRTRVEMSDLEDGVGMQPCLYPVNQSQGVQMQLTERRMTDSSPSETWILRCSALRNEAQPPVKWLILELYDLTD